MTRVPVPLLAALLLLASVRIAPGQGDTCATATAIPSLPFASSGTTCGKADDYHETCPFPPAGAPDVVYSYTPSANELLTIDLCPSDFDTRVYVFAGSCPAVPDSGQAVACNDDACGVDGWRSNLVFGIWAGTTYFIVIDGFGTGCGDYQLVMTATPSIVGDRCGDPWQIPALPFIDSKNTCGLYDDYHETCPFPDAGAPDGVYRYAPAQDAILQFDLCSSDYDTRLYLFAGACPAGPLSGSDIACNDDACGVDGFRSRLVDVPVIAGEEYFIVIDGWGADCGTFQLEVEEAPPPGPGESCLQPIEVAALPYSAMIETSGTNRHQHQCQFIFDGAPEKVLRYVAPADEVITVRACTADFDPRVTVATGPCPLPHDLAPVALACADDGCGAEGLGSRIGAVFLSAGETAWIIVDGHRAGEQGSVLVEIERTCAPDHPSVALGEIPLSAKPVGLALSPSGDRLYVANLGSDSISVVDTASDTVLGTTPVGDAPYRVVITPDGSRLYACEYFGGTIRCLDAETMALIDVIPFAGNPLGLAISPDGSRLWCTNETAGSVRSWSIPGHVVQSTVSGLGSPREVIVTPDGVHVFVSDFYGERIWKIPVATLVATPAAIAGTPQSMAIAPDGDHLLVGTFGWDRSPDTIPVLRISDLAMVAELRIGAGLEEMVFVPGTNVLLTTYWGHSHLPAPPDPEIGAGLGSVEVLRVPDDFAIAGNPAAPPLLEVSETLIPRLGDYIFGLAVLPDGSKAYASASVVNGGLPLPHHVSVIGFPGNSPVGRFRRGDANADGQIDIADPIGILQVLFSGGASSCPRALDANDDEQVDIADPITLLAGLFQGQPPPPPPANCALDPTRGALCCDVEACP